MMNYRTLCPTLTLTSLIVLVVRKPTGPITPTTHQCGRHFKMGKQSGRVGIRTPKDAVSGNFNLAKKIPTKPSLLILWPFLVKAQPS